MLTWCCSEKIPLLSWARWDILSIKWSRNLFLSKYSCLNFIAILLLDFVLSGLLFSIFYSRMFSFVAYSLFGCLVNWWVIFFKFRFFSGSWSQNVTQQIRSKWVMLILPSSRCTLLLCILWLLITFQLCRKTTAGVWVVLVLRRWVCVSVCPRCERKTAWAIHSKSKVGRGKVRGRI